MPCCWCFGSVHWYSRQFMGHGNCSGVGTRCPCSATALEHQDRHRTAGCVAAASCTFKPGGSDSASTHSAEGYMGACTSTEWEWLRIRSLLMRLTETPEIRLLVKRCTAEGPHTIQCLVTTLLNVVSQICQ